jgi:filamentous hemagglutinin family protein
MTTKFWLCFLTLTSLVVSAQTAISQTYQPSNRTPVADNTLGTQVSGSGNNFNITGGLNKGQTLFHSFTDFSVPTNGQANFTNPVGNRDIITRVTGNVFSDINGLVNTNGANFFLINPNGIVFGTGAQLNVGKAFVGSTANSLDLVDGAGRTITFGTNANGDAPLLSVAPNVLFDVSRLNMGGGTGAISNFGTLQTPNNSQYIGLIGGNVTLDGGKIIAPGGRVDIGGLNSGGTVTIASDGLVFGGSNPTRSNVTLTSGAVVRVRAVGTLDTVNTFVNNATAPGSSINISANNLDILNSGFKSSAENAAIDAGLEENSGTYTNTSGDINFNATGKVTIDNSYIKNTLRAGATGNIGGIKIQAGALDVKNDSFIVTTTSGKGNAGNIDINTIGDINVSGNDLSSTNIGSIANTKSNISSDTYGQGDTGKITINTQGKLSIANKGAISSLVSITGVGNSKGIDITARELELANNSSISTDTIQFTQVDGKGNAGDINIKTTGDIKVFGYDPSAINPTTSGRSEIASNGLGKGDTGKITIDTQGKLSVVNSGSINSYINFIGAGNSKGIKINARELELVNGSKITTATAQLAQIAGKGNAGDIEVKTIGDIKLAAGSIFDSSTYFQGNAGKIEIETQGKFSLSDRSSITSTIGSSANGNGRDISIAAREIELNNSFMINGTQQITQVNGKGKSGDIILQAKDTISFKNISAISTESSGAGQAGNVSITAAQLLLNNSGLLSDATSVSGGNVTVALSDKFLLQNGSSIITRSGSSEKNGNGGNITISSPLIIALPGNNDIAADANGGNGGNVNITSQGLFGIQYRPLGSEFTSDITASSQFGQSGTVNVDTPGTDPGRDSTELPNTATDASNQISQVCSANTSQNKLTVTGRGGLPANASDLLTPDVVWQDARATSSQPAASGAPTPTKLAPPAVGWVFDGKGKVTLIAAGNQGQPTGTSVVCPTTKEVK